MPPRGTTPITIEPGARARGLNEPARALGAFGRWVTFAAVSDRPSAAGWQGLALLKVGPLAPGLAPPTFDLWPGMELRPRGNSPALEIPC